MTLPENYGLPTPSIRWDEHGQPYSEKFNDIYYQPADGLEESRHVFLRGNQIPDRLRAPENWSNDNYFVIAELGFGTGLNFLATWQEWNSARAESKSLQSKWLHFVTTEQFPLPLEIMEKSHEHFSELNIISKQLRENMVPPVIGTHRIYFPKDCIKLTIIFGDANETLSQEQVGNFQADAWYLDGFSPAENPELWNENLADHVKRLSGIGTTLATYTSAGWVRRLFEAETKEGKKFTITKAKGFGRKREMITGKILPEIKAVELISPPEKRKRKQIAIIGGGIAGCTTAHALATRGFDVALFEAAGQLADDASGNKAAVVMPQISKIPTERSLFSIAAFLNAQKFYNFFSVEFDLNWKQVGVVRLAAHRQLQSVVEVFEKLQIPEMIAQKVTQENGEQISGLPVPNDGLYFPLGGFMSPSLFCEAMASNEKIQIHLNTIVQSIEQKNNAWILNTSQQEHQFDQVIICNSYSANKFLQTEFAPLHKVRGQVVHLPSQEKLTPLKTVFCQSGYMTPESDGEHLIGASWDRGVDDRDLRLEYQNDLLAQVKEWNPAVEYDVNILYPGRASFRCTVPDRSPLVGDVPNGDGADYENLFMNVGHGSHGVTNAPLCAEYLASTISGEPSPLNKAMENVLKPARFLERSKTN